MKCLSVETICCKIMRKCTGPEGGLAGPGPSESPDPSSGKNASNCGLILLTLPWSGTPRPSGQCSGLGLTWWGWWWRRWRDCWVHPYPGLWLPSSVLPSSSHFSAGLGPWLGPERGSLTQTHQHRSKIMQQYFFTYNLFAKSAGPEHPPPWINHFLAQYCANFL